jgi:Cu(I)/Ag(I) efflux system periplasmic protein CusF
MQRSLACSLALIVSMSIIPLAGAQSQGMGGMDMKGMDMKDMKKDAKKAAAKLHKGVGVVKNVDAEKRTVSVAHEPIKSMEWPAMTMSFTAKDKKMLEGIKPGAKVEFEFVQQGSKYTITSIK